MNVGDSCVIWVICGDTGTGTSVIIHDEGSLVNGRQTDMLYRESLGIEYV